MQKSQKMDSLKLESNLFESVINGRYNETKQSLRNGADPNKLLKEGISIFHVAVGVNADYEFTKLFLKNGANPNVKSVDNWTPLHVCACWNKLNSLKLLLENGADPYLINNDNQTALDLANECNNTECAKLLKEFMRKTGKSIKINSIDQNNEINTKTMVRSSTIDDNNSLITDDTITIQDNNENNKENRQNNESLIKLKDLEKVINDLIELKLKEKQGKTVGSSLNSDKISTHRSSLSSLNRNSPSTSTTTHTTSRTHARFHSPEASSRLPLPLRSKRDSSVGNNNSDRNASPIQMISPKMQKKERSPMPSYNNSINSNHQNDGEKSTNVYSKIKNWLNKVGNTHIDSSPFSSFCLPHNSLQHVNSDFQIKANSVPSSPVEKNQHKIKSMAPLPPPPPPPSTPNFGTGTMTFSEIGLALENLNKKTHELFNQTDVKNYVVNGNSNSNGACNENAHERIYQLEDDDIYFKETTLLTSDKSTINNDENYYTAANTSSVIYSWDAYDTDNIKEQILDRTITIKTENEIPDEIKRLTDGELRMQLEDYGDKPGPITHTTRYVYELRLMQLKTEAPLANKVINSCFNEFHKGFSVELIDALNGRLDLELDSIETNMASCFLNNNGYWREGHMKCCFNYLLIDPRVSQNLAARAKVLDKQEVFRVFIASIFYIGKGTRSRPYAHLYDALKIWKVDKDSLVNNKGKEHSRKIKQIMNIWNDNCGVVSLHCFQNVIPCEAYTREASMIDCIGLQHLTNLKRGDYYGIANTWPSKKQKILGAILLRKACDIFIAEGERQIKPIDI